MVYKRLHHVFFVLASWKVTFLRVKMLAVMRSQSQSLRRRNEKETETERRTGTGTGTGSGTGAEVEIGIEAGAGTGKRESGTEIMTEGQTGTRREGGTTTERTEGRRREGVGTRYRSRRPTSSGLSWDYLHSNKFFIKHIFAVFFLNVLKCR